MAIEDFIAAMTTHVPPESRVLVCQFRGDPNDDTKGKWRARPLTSAAILDEQANIYFTVSAMKQNDRGEYRRRKANYSGGLLLMIDDLGDGPGAKHPLSIIDALEPTALIETSPANYQAVYMFDRLVEDEETFSALIRSFIARQFLNNDPGMAGVNRVFRPPAGINGKAKYAGWEVTMAKWNPAARYSVERIAEAFGLTLHRAGPRIPAGATTDKAANIRAFIAVRSALRAAGMLKRERADLEGWIDVRCPWVGNHTARADTGSSIREPAEENGWGGAYRCHHASCADKGWRELTDWLAEEQEAVLAMVNQQAGGWK